MTFTQASHGIRKRWKLIVIVASLVTGCGAAYTAKLTPIYHAGARVSVEASSLNELRVLSNPFIGQAEPLIQQRIMSGHAEVKELSYVEISRELGFSDTRQAQWIFQSTHISWSDDSGSLYVSATGSDPRFVVKIANAYAHAVERYPILKRHSIIAEWRSYVAGRLQSSPYNKIELDTVAQQISEFESIPPVRYTFIEAAVEPSVPIYPNKSTNIMTALNMGLLLGVAIALLLETRDIEKRLSMDTKRETDS